MAFESSGSRAGSPSACAAGLVLVLLGAVIAGLAAPTWAGWLARLGEPWAGESSRWVSAGLLIIAGASFLRCRPIFFLLTSASIMLTAYCADQLLGASVSRAVDGCLGDGMAGRMLPASAMGFGYLVHLAPRAGAFSTRGLFGLLVVALAGLGMVHGWYYDGLEWVAPKLGGSAERLAAEWNSECAWAVALIFVAIGVASSRTSSIHVLIAIMLGALAYDCVQTGSVHIEVFPELGKSLPTESLRNVALWRWIAAGELVLFGMVLLHQALGMGAISVAFAVAWMAVGMSVYRSVGTMTACRILNSALAARVEAAGVAPRAMDPLANMGLPVTTTLTGPLRADRTGAASSTDGSMPTNPRTAPAGPVPAGTAGSPPSGVSENHANTQQQTTPASGQTAAEQSFAELIRSGDPREAVGLFLPFAWMTITAGLAGLLTVVGLRMLSSSSAGRTWLLIGLWFVLGLGCAWLWTVWPRNPDQSWLQWLAGFLFSRYHGHLIWLTFLASVAVVGIWAVRGSGSDESWIFSGIYAAFVGTALTLVATAVLIQYGGFPRLPVWTYIVIAAGQSALAWILMMHLTLRGRICG